MVNELEEISWKDGKFIDTENKKVKAKPIGHPRLIREIPDANGENNEEEEVFYQKLHESLQYGDEQANAFARGKILNFSREIDRQHTHIEFGYSIQLYKI